MRPCAVARPARLAAWARPRFRRMVMASSMLPLASLSAALHSIIPAPVLSRSCLTCSAVIADVAISRLLRTQKAPAGWPAQTLSACALGASGGWRRLAPLGPHRRSQPGGGIGFGRFLGARRFFLRNSRFAHPAAGVDGLANLRREQPDRSKRVVVARNDEVDFIGVAVGVDHADDGNLQLARLVDGDLLLARV